MRTVNVSGSTLDRRAARRSAAGRALPSRADVGDRRRAARSTAEPFGEPVLERGRRDERARWSRRRGAAARAEHRAREHRLRRGDRRVGVAHRAPRRSCRPSTRRAARTPKNAGSHNTRSASLPDLDRSDLALEAVRDRRADRVLRDVAPGTAVVGVRRRRAARRDAASSRAPSAMCAAPPRRRGPSPVSPSRSSRSRRGRAGCLRPRSSTVGCGSRRTRGPRDRGLRWWHTISMSRCSAIVLTVCGRVGFVDDGSTFGCDGDGDDVGRVAAARAFGVVRVDRAARDRGERARRRNPPRSACRCGSPPARRPRRRHAGTRRSRPASSPSPRAA